MQCYNCGSALNGTETMCPMCGAQLNQYTNQPMQNGMNGQMGNMGQPNQMMQNQTIPEQAPMMEQNMSMNSMQQYQQGMPMNQNEFAYYAQNGNNVGYQNQTNMGFPTAPNQMGQMPVPPMNEISLASETEEQPKVSKTMLIIIFASAALFIILGIVLAITTPKEEEEPVITPTPTPTETTTPIQSSTVNYGGYTFNILDGYTTKQDEKYGLIFNNGNIAYSVKVDYTNNYNTYKQILSQNYPTQAQNLELVANNENYLILQMESDNKEIRTLHYVKSANENTSFVGVIVKKDKSPAGVIDLNDLTTILKEASPIGENQKGTELDGGKSGIINLPNDYTSFVFQETQQTTVE